MITFDASKEKEIQMMIESSGITNDKLKFTFVLDTGDIQYGFPCQFNESTSQVTVKVPPLEVIIANLKTSVVEARLDVTGDDKYYLKPFNEAVQINMSPKIKKIEVSEKNVSENLEILVSSLTESDVKEDEQKEIVEKKEEKQKPSGISAFFNKDK